MPAPAIRRPRLSGVRGDRVSRAMVFVSALGNLAASTGLLFSGRFDDQPIVMIFGVVALGVAGWCGWQLWTDHLQAVAVMVVVAASIGVMGGFVDHSFQLAVSTILVLHAAVGAVLISDTRRFWAFILFVGAAGGFDFLAHQFGLGLGIGNMSNAEIGNLVVQGIVFWTAALIFRRVRDQIVTQEQIHRSKDRFLAGVGHELRTPLTAVLAYSELVAGDETTPKEVKEWVKVVVDEARAMSATIDDFTVISRLANQLLTLSPTTFPVMAEIQRTLTTIRSSAISPRIVGSADIHAHTDPDRLRQLLRILITNALQHASEEVDIVVDADAELTWIEVRDDGAGLPQETKSLLEASWRSHAEPGQPEHLGRGLIVALELAHVMNIDLTYSRQGNVTVFRLSLPTRSTSFESDPMPPSRVEAHDNVPTRHQVSR